MDWLFLNLILWIVLVSFVVMIIDLLVCVVLIILILLKNFCCVINLVKICVGVFFLLGLLEFLFIFEISILVIVIVVILIMLMRSLVIIFVFKVIFLNNFLCLSEGFECIVLNSLLRQIWLFYIVFFVCVYFIFWLIELYIIELWLFVNCRLVFCYFNIYGIN